ncbi:MAG: deoxyribose-phosphate aldolase [Pirellulaceae bacterium]
MDYSYADIARMIDHSLLGPVMTDEELERGLQIAIDYQVASVCIKPYYLRRCATRLAGTTVQPSTVIGFPHGGHTTNIKVAEVLQALADGGTELDCVVNIGKVLSGDWDYVRRDLQVVTECTHRGGAKIKVIFENCFLQNPHKIKLCEICGEIGVDWVKTSTGYGTSGATVEDLTLMRRHAPATVQVKAAGGIRTLDALLEARAAGATRAGATRTVEMLDECKRRLQEV